jgi:asparagine synthase (glutamine-hydrolysing)
MHGKVGKPSARGKTRPDAGATPHAMCGIAGLIAAPGAPEPDAAQLVALARALAHRGPDGAGQTVQGRVGLVHTRLAIIDLAGGDQPLHAGSAVLVGNGEIYNYRELRTDMPQTRFATASDNEVPLHLWLRDGVEFTRPLRGMYALAVHERAGGTVTLARDPFGIKPLYYIQTDAGLAFASEPQALLAAGLAPRALRPAARDELLQMQFTTGAETIFPGIRRVLPGETLLCAEGRVLERSRLPALPKGGPEAIGEEAALARLDRALTESVDLHQRSDVPYGMFLSGGIDSTAILALMARLNSAPVLAFTAGFAAPGVADEREAAAAAARALGARHATLEVTEAMVWRHLPEIVASLDDPAADYAIIPTWFLARRAREEVKVVLSGEGGDEIFAGYGRYRRAMRPWWRGGRAMRARGTFDGLDVLRAHPAAWREGLVAAEAQAAGGGRTKLASAQAADIAEWLPNDLLLKLDRCLMAHGVEGRTPFLDPGVAAAAFRLPDALKVRGGLGKYLLRQWLARHCPAARPFARKQGFTVPIGAWIAGAGARLGKLVAAQPGIAEIAVPDRVAALFRHAAGKREGAAAWHLLFYALWHRAHILGLKPAGDVFDTLAAT